MTILVCPLSRVAEMVDAHTPERIVSLLDPGSATPEVGPEYAGRHLRLAFHDVHVPTEGQVTPSAEHVRDLLAFLGAWTRAGSLLVHCRAGIGRSTAAGYIAACLHNPDIDENDIAVGLRRVAPLARPNETLVRLADDAMTRNGRMSRAVSDTGRDLPWIDVSEGVPFAMPSDFALSDTESE